MLHSSFLLKLISVINDVIFVSHIRNLIPMGSYTKSLSIKRSDKMSTFKRRPAQNINNHNYYCLRILAIYFPIV